MYFGGSKNQAWVRRDWHVALRSKLGLFGPANNTCRSPPSRGAPYCGKPRVFWVRRPCSEGGICMYFGGPKNQAWVAENFSGGRCARSGTAGKASGKFYYISPCVDYGSQCVDYEHFADWFGLKEKKGRNGPGVARASSPYDAGPGGDSYPGVAQEWLGPRRAIVSERMESTGCICSLQRQSLRSCPGPSGSSRRTT